MSSTVDHAVTFGHPGGSAVVRRNVLPQPLLAVIGVPTGVAITLVS
jgi:hypothetical protein